MAQELYDTIIIGGGPAGVAAAVYAARKRLATLVITTRFGGQSIVSSQIENWIGEVSITGKKLAKRLEEVGKYADIVTSGDDLGWSFAPYMSPADFRRLVKWLWSPDQDTP